MWQVDMAASDKASWVFMVTWTADVDVGFDSSLSCDSNLFLNLYRESLSDTHYKKYALQQALIGPPHHLRVLRLRYVSSFTNMFLFLVDSIPTPLAPLFGTSRSISGHTHELILESEGRARRRLDLVHSIVKIAHDEDSEELTKISANIQEITFEIQQSKLVVDSIPSIMDEHLQSCSALIAEVKSFSSIDFAQIKTLLADYETLHSSMKAKIEQLESEKFLINNQSEDLQKRLEEACLSGENSSRDLTELSEHYETKALDWAKSNENAVDPLKDCPIISWNGIMNGMDIPVGILNGMGNPVGKETGWINNPEWNGYFIFVISIEDEGLNYYQGDNVIHKLNSMGTPADDKELPEVGMESADKHLN
ncbi:hypothetical protein LXL04_038418 [Taraxacum kok-saghyz]